MEKTFDNREDIQQEKEDKNRSNKVQKFIGHIQMLWASWMNRKVNQISAGYLRLLVIAFTGLFSFLSVYSVFFSQAKLNTGHIRTPQNITTGSNTNKKKTTSENLQYEKFRHFLQYMDSLSLSEKGKKMYDDIMITRPGLYDSVLLLEMIYKQNK